jgi:hypothetical protein
MESKWDIDVTPGVIEISRSWTGLKVYEVPYKVDSGGDVIINGYRVRSGPFSLLPLILSVLGIDLDVKLCLEKAAQQGDAVDDYASG